jgi:hypothetical protein
VNASYVKKSMSILIEGQDWILSRSRKSVTLPRVESRPSSAQSVTSLRERFRDPHVRSLDNTEMLCVCAVCCVGSVVTAGTRGANAFIRADG